MICFIVAMETEAKFVLEKFENVNKTLISGKYCFTGNLFGKECALLISDIGKVNATLTTQIAIDKFAPELIFNFGTAGGANDNVNALSYYAITKCCQYDFDMTELDDVPLSYIQSYKRCFFDCEVKGLDFLEKTVLGSADRFSNKIEDIKSVNGLGCSLRDMEGGAIAHVCLANNIPVYMIKGVTDTYSKPASVFYDNLIEVCKGFPAIIEKALKNIVK